MDENHIYKEIEDYAYGRLSVSRIEDLWVKILENPSLLSYLEVLADLKNISPAGGVQEVRETAAARYHRSWLFRAAAACLIIIAGVILYFQFPAGGSLPRPQAAVPPSDFESVEVFRSADNRLTPTQQRLNQGFDRMIRHQDKQAVVVFRKLLSERPDSSIQAGAFFNLGAIAYNRKDFSQALTDFRRALSRVDAHHNRWLPEKINWYLSQTYLQLKHPHKAKEFARRTAEYDGYYKKRADSLLLELRR